MKKLINLLIMVLGSLGVSAQNWPTSPFAQNLQTSQKDSDLFLKENWEPFLTSMQNIDSKDFRFVVKNYTKFSELYGDSIVYQKIKITYNLHAGWLARDTLLDKEKRFIDFKQSVVESKLPNMDRLLAETDMNFYYTTNNWTKLFEVVVSGIEEKHYWDKAQSLAFISSVFAKNVSDPIILRRSVKWIERSIVLEDVPASNKTYAKLLFKLGEKSKALEIAERALSLAQVSKQSDIQDYEDLLQELKK